MARLHDKYLIADHTAYILGGRNTYDFFLGDETDYINYDWDILVYNEAGTEASSLYELEEYYQSVWTLPDCRAVLESMPALRTSRQKVLDAGKELEELYQQMQREHEEWFVQKDYTQMTELMLQSQEEVIFHTPYIMCNDYMMERLEKLCDANGNVKMMTNSVANNGNPFGASDYMLHKQELLDTGLHILEYDQGVSYHGKCFTIGDRITAVGSFNWDMRSVYLDTELMLVVDSVPLNAVMREYMESYEETALEVKDADSYVLQAGQVPQEKSTKKKIMHALLIPLNGFLRFLM